MTLGQTVIYTSKIDNGPGNAVRSPAIVLRTKESTVGAVIDRWSESAKLAAIDGTTHSTTARPDGVRELGDDEVDLVVFGLGKTYREYGVSYDPNGGLGTWSLPTANTPGSDEPFMRGERAYRYTFDVEVQTVGALGELDKQGLKEAIRGAIWDEGPMLASVVVGEVSND